jgi:mannitol/fructose-specific phosphotransferase system IIA component (Ntr-type)
VLNLISNLSAQTLATFTSPQLVCPALCVNTASEVISQLCAVLFRDGRVQQLKEFQDAVLARESISPTAFVSGWALPHARLPDVPELRFAVARTVQPLAWFGNTRCQVQTIFLFAVPEHAAKSYLNLISAVARLTQNAVLLERLRVAADPSSIVAVLGEVPVPHPHGSTSIGGNPQLSAPNSNAISLVK